MASGTSIAGANVSTEQTSESRKLAATKAFRGETPVSIAESDTPVDPRISQAQRDIRKITMKTNSTPEPREDFYPSIEQPQTQPQSSQTASSDATVEAKAVEDTKPLDPQQADLAKARRALQVRERQIAERERALESKATQPDLMSRLKTTPLEVLQEAGVTYDDLTEAILANQSGLNPEIQKLKQELKATKEEISKTLSERDSQQEQQVFAEMKRNITQMVASNDEFELVRRAGMEDEAVDLIRRTWKESGEALTETDALKLVEEELTKEYQSLSEAKKFKATQQVAAAPIKPAMRTLTSQGAATPQMSRRERAIAAARGVLKR